MAVAWNTGTSFNSGTPPKITPTGKQPKKVANPTYYVMPKAARIARDVAMRAVDGRVKTPKQKQLEKRRKWLANDPTFKRQRDMLAEQRTAYLDDYNQALQRTRSDYDLMMQRLAESRTEGRRTQDESFGARGMLFSGAYGQDVTDLNKRYSQEESDLLTSKTRAEDDLAVQREAKLREIKNERLNARQNAIRRYAEQQGVRY